jgi:SAM-dependent methyltransferase
LGGFGAMWPAPVGDDPSGAPRVSVHERHFDHLPTPVQHGGPTVLGPYARSVVSPAAAFDALAGTYDDDPHHERIAQLMAAGLRADEPADVVIDVATGTGAGAFAVLRTLAPHHVLGVDISGPMIERAKAKAASADRESRIEWRVAPAVPLDVADGSADVVLCASALHFLGIAALRDWRRVLRPGGQLAFSIPVAADFHPSPAFRAQLPTDLTVPADAAAGGRMAGDAGFVDVRVETTPPDADDRPRRSFLVWAAAPRGHDLRAARTLPHGL